jgi:hypothetical protein
LLDSMGESSHMNTISITLKNESNKINGPSFIEYQKQPPS